MLRPATQTGRVGRGRSTGFSPRFAQQRFDLLLHGTTGEPRAPRSELSIRHSTPHASPERYTTSSIPLPTRPWPGYADGRTHTAYGRSRRRYLAQRQQLARSVQRRRRKSSRSRSQPPLRQLRLRGRAHLRRESVQNCYRNASPPDCTSPPTCSPTNCQRAGRRDRRGQRNLRSSRRTTSSRRVHCPRRSAWRRPKVIGVSAVVYEEYTSRSPAFPWGAYYAQKAIKLCTSRWKRPRPESSPAGSKAAGLYIICTLAKDEAARHLAARTRLGMRRLQGSALGSHRRENLFLLINGELHTPTTETILNGITRLTRSISTARPQAATSKWSSARSGRTNWPAPPKCSSPAPPSKCNRSVPSTSRRSRSVRSHSS